MGYEVPPYRFEPAPETEASLVSGFAGIERLIADPLRFKLKLGIGKDAFEALKHKRIMLEAWGAARMAAKAAGVVASKPVATTVFASTAKGGLLALVGLGKAAATPVGWIVAAAVITAGAYYGVTRLFGRLQGPKVDIIPRTRRWTCSAPRCSGGPGGAAGPYRWGFRRGRAGGDRGDLRGGLGL